jgi:ABC-type methionine transport system ATPase subunit
MERSDASSQTALTPGPAGQPRADGALPGTPLFALRNVTQQRGATTVLHDLTVDFPRTTTTAIVGPSGAGKTSLLRLLNRLDDPTSGEVSFDGRPLTSYPVAALRRRVGFVFQRAAMFPGSVADNLRAAVELGGANEASNAPPMDRVLTAVGLSPDFASREAGRLSGGEQQRVSIARALMTRPEVLLLDEPTSALDPEVAERLLATIGRLTRERGVAVVMVTHRLSEARHISTHMVMLEGGRLVEAGPTAQLFASPNTERAREYLSTAE